MAKDLHPEALALLGFVRRHIHGGPVAPATNSASFSAAYDALISSGLIERSAGRAMWVITDSGERTLRERYDNER